ncbi:MAG: MerR family transcriptional regulator [Armatimonas sp.]
MNLSLREIADSLEMPESTLRLYREEFEEFVPVQGEGRRRRYDERAEEVLRQIATLKRAGWKGDAIRDELRKQRRPEALVRRRTTEDRLDELIALVRAQGEQLAMLRAEVGQLRQALGEAPLSWEEALRSAERGQAVV